jgi:AraC family transcriptional regulator of adaptative response/methylated-DNA-[protein]-cysteine methyltransferase
VAQSTKGVCFVQFSDNPISTLEQLQKTFPSAFLQGADTTFDATVAKIVGLVEHSNPTTIPLDARGTVFQKKVWDALQHIPLGQTWSYQQLADHIKMPSSVRAVANACAKNNIALLVPCHRVVRSNGDLSGYRWGVERKASLLKNEKTLTK